jgi:NAD+ diphosphatase
VCSSDLHGHEICARTGSDPTIFMPVSPGITGSPGDSVQYLGNLGIVPCYVLEMTAGEPCPEGFVLAGVRDLDGKIPDEELAIAGLAVHVADYHRTTLFCGTCGTRTISSHTERAKICPTCHSVTYTRLSPAIIVLVRKGDTILLVRGKKAPAGRFSLVAGFVEPGETIEQTAHREVKEEAGIEIFNVRYMASEPWPFPNSLMIGFVADYAGGVVTPDGIEIGSAGWFDRDNLPDFPARISLTRALIDRWITESLPEHQE